MQADHLDEAVDLRLGAADAELAVALAQAPRDQREIHDQGRIGEDQLVQVDENRPPGMQRSRQRGPSEALGGPILVTGTADHRGVFAERDDGVPEPTQPSGLDSRAMPSVEDVEAALTNVIDPELGLDFVELGLIYGVEVSGGDVHVTFSLTSPGCPIGPQVSEQIEEFVTELDGVSSVESTMTFTPPWTPDRMSEDAKFALGY